MNATCPTLVGLRQRLALRVRGTRCASLAAIVLVMTLSGCSALYSPHTRTIEHRMEVLNRLPRSNMRPIDPRLLGQTPPPEHLVNDGDILGIYIEGALGAEGTELPVRFPDDRFVSPAIGYPTPVRNGGFIRVPQVGVMHVRGMTAWQIEERIRHVLTVEKKLILPDEALIHVSLMWKRGINVMVIRQEELSIPHLVSPSNGTDADRRSGRVVQLPAFRNDVMNALLESGGFPNDQAENAVYVFKRQDRRDAGSRAGPARDIGGQTEFPGPSAVQLAAYSAVMNERGSSVDGIPGPLRPANHTGLQPVPRTSPACPVVGHSLGPAPRHALSAFPEVCHCAACSLDNKHPNAVRIPLSINPGEHPGFSANDVILEDGDIILVESRENEVFFTAGLLGGGQYIMPRNYDMDVIDAVLLADSYSRQTQLNSPTRAIGGVSVLNRDVTVGASRVIIERKGDDGQTQRFRISLYAAMRDPNKRVLIEPGDRLFLEYTPIEACLAFAERQLFDQFLSGLPTVLTD